MISTMATVAFRNSSLCEFCHTKPKYGGHPFCGKTCATQAAGLCTQCYQKPKFGNYDYCGKNCAAQAQAQQPAPKPPTKQAPQATAPQQQTGPLNIVKQVVNAAKKPQKANAVPARQAPARSFQTQHQPATQANQAPLGQWVHAAAAQIPNILTTLSPPAASAQQQARSSNASVPLTTSKSYNTPPTKQVAFTAGPPTNMRSTHSQPQSQPQSRHPVPPPYLIDPQAQTQAVSPTILDYPDSPAVCQLPGCEEYAHVDANGDVSDYCSQAHREEAVDKGLVDPCIKCLIMPQSKADYFCSRTCREEALHKGLALPA